MRPNSLKLRSKFYLSFGAVLLLGALVAVLMLVMLQRSSSSYKQVLETDRLLAEQALAIQAGKLRISEALRGRLLHPYGDFGDQELSKLSQAYDELNNSYGAAHNLASDPQIIRTLDEIGRIDGEQLRPLEDRILGAIERQESAEAETLYFDQYVSARAEQQVLLDQLNTLASQRISSAVERTTRLSRLVGIIALALTALLILFGVVLSYYLTRSFEQPVAKLMKAARAIASGDLDQKLSLDRKDELGEMADVLNVMVMNLRGLNEDLATQVTWLRETKDELARTQGQLVQNEKLAALGQLVAGVAHELNNPISFVYSNTVLLQDSFAQVRGLIDYYDSHQEIPAPVRATAERIKEEIDYDYLVKDISQALEDCHEGARRVRDIVKNLKTFSRLDDTELRLIDISEGIDSTVRLLGNYFHPDRVRLHRDYVDTPKVECFGAQLSQVWMNLMVNAAQAMKSKGDLWVKTWVERDRVMVSFRDNGPGIPEDVLTRVFDPFFTTKPVGEGTGLGLSIVHGIIDRHGGEIGVDSRPGEGTTFTISLPVSKSNSPVEKETDQEPVAALA
jgi:signal transduction histidine kinase